MKKLKALALMLIVPIILSGCISAKDSNEDTKYEKDFGTYEVQSGWIEEKAHSTNDVFFYVKKGTEKDSQPNNIAISEGKNKFKISEHEDFEKAIMGQLQAQMPKNSDVKIESEGIVTTNNNRVFVVTIKEKSLETKFYYIMGDYKFVMVQATCFNDENDVYKVSDYMVNSFVWNEEQ